MSADLIERLNDGDKCMDAIDAAIERIEELEAENAKYKAELRIGDLVCISPEFERYDTGWKYAIHLEIIGINLVDGEIEYTIDDGTSAGCDGWKRSELIKEGGDK